MITLIHGENSIKARERFTSLIDSYKTKGTEIVRIDPLKEIGPQLTGNSLFAEKNVFVIENPKKVPSKIEKSAEVVILCDGNAPVTVTKSLPKDVVVEKFDLPKKLFSFLEIIYPENAKNCINALHELIQTEAVELVFFMIARQFRDMYWVLTDENSMGILSWRAGKLKFQANKFTKETLKDIIADLSLADYKAKTGETDLTLSLDLILTRALE